MAEPYATNIPNYSQYGQAGLLAKTAYDNALTRLNRQRADTLRQYGYAGDIDQASGTLSNLHVDPNNPYGQYQSMLGSHSQQWEQAGDSAQERGLGRGGLAAQGQTMLRHRFGGEAAALGEGLTGSISGFQEEQQSAAYDRDAALYEAQLQQARDAIGAGDFSPADYSGVDYPSYGSDPYSDPYSADPGTDPGSEGPYPTVGGAPKQTHAQLISARNRLVGQLLSNGTTDIAGWARRNPELAAKYGLRPVKGANTAAVKAARAVPRPTPRTNAGWTQVKAAPKPAPRKAAPKPTPKKAPAKKSAPRRR